MEEAQECVHGGYAEGDGATGACLVRYAKLGEKHGDEGKNFSLRKRERTGCCRFGQQVFCDVINLFRPFVLELIY